MRDAIRLDVDEAVSLTVAFDTLQFSLVNLCSLRTWIAALFACACLYSCVCFVVSLAILARATITFVAACSLAREFMAIARSLNKSAARERCSEANFPLRA